jgi:raffinose/stachyose/melibiose transport system permease protein
MIMIAALCFFCFPFALLLSDSFKTNSQILTNPLSLPTSLHFGNFKAAITKMGYIGGFMNTFYITFCGTGLILLFSSMAAHYFVRNKTRFNNTFFFMMVASMIIPFQSIMIPLVYIYGQKLHWISMAPRLTLIFMYLGFGSSLAVFIYHGFIKGIPFELEEASLIDGCNRKQTFFKVVYPILIPTTMTIMILDILWIWNDFLLPLLILQNAGNEKFTLPLALQIFNDFYTTDFEKFLPAVLLVILPVVIVFLFAQRFIIQGVTQGSIK